MRILIMNRHALTWATGDRGEYLPVPPADRFLLTRTFGGGLAGYDPAAFPHLTVIDTYYPDRLEAAARWLVETHLIERVVALHEKDMILAARLRKDYRLPGMDVDTTLRFRDKVLMKDTLAARGYTALPRYRAVAAGEVLRDVPWDGDRVVVKSRWGVGSQEVRVATGPAAATAAVRELAQVSDPGQLEVEEFIDGGMYHCDCVCVDGVIRFAAVSEYLARPGDFAEGGIAGSVLLLDGAVHDAVLAENARVLELLGMTSGVTHVEFFRTASGRLVFCEAAARPGGGGIADIISRAYGVNIVRAAVRLQCGVVPDLSDLSGPVARPRRVVGVVGIYHSNVGVDRPADHIRDRTRGVDAYTFARQEIAGRVRHCTDYAHTIVVSGDTRAEFDRNVAEVVRAIRVDGRAPAAH